MQSTTQKNRHTYESITSRSRNRLVQRHASQDFNGAEEAQAAEPSLRSRLTGWWPFAASLAATRTADRAPNEAQSRPSGVASPPAATSAWRGLRQSEQQAAIQMNISDAVWPAGDRRWMPDEKCPVCFHCGASFGAFRRRHHCRLCGQIFCHGCSCHFVPGKLIGRPGEQQSRLCEACTLYCDGLGVQRSGEPSGFGAGGSSSSQALPKRAAPKSQLQAPATTAVWAGFERRARVQTVEEDSASNASEVDEEYVAGDLDAQASCGDSDGDWQNYQDGPSRESTEETQSGIEEEGPSWLADETITLASDEEDAAAAGAWYWDRAPWGDPRFSVLLKSRREEVGLPAASIQHLSHLELEVLEEPSRVDRRAGQIAATHGKAWSQLSDVAFRHFMKSVRACCNELGGGLEDPDHILTICKLAQQVNEHLSPCTGDSLDVLKYVKIKRVPGGHIRDSLWVDGVVFSRDIAHRKMRSEISDCHVAVLREPLSFDHDHRLTRLDDLRRQEADFIDLKVEKIADDLRPRPELLLCQAGVSQMAQEKLRNKNITLVLGVPAHILDAVARCTGARVLPSVDSIVRCTAGGRNAVVGKCRSFSVRHTGETGEEGYKPLAIIEGSRPNLFSTVCLRGGGSCTHQEALALLTNAKRVLRWAIRLARHLQLESELLFEMWCEPWPRAEPKRLGSAGPRAREEADSKEQVYSCLDIICYRVSTKEERSCTPPESLRFPAYALPQHRASGGAAGMEAWAGGSDAPEACVRDSTLQEWLMSCLAPDRAQTRVAVSSSYTSAGGPVGAVGSVVGAPSNTSSLTGDDLQLNAAASSMGMHSVGGADPQPSGGSSSMSGAWALDPPVPSSGEVLCFQSRGSRVVVELRESREEMRRLTSTSPGAANSSRCAEAGASTRWSLLHSGDDDGSKADGQDGGAGHSGSLSFQPAPAAGTGAGQNSIGARGQGPSAGQVEMWRFCRRCARQVTPRSALSSSAGWHSMSKFLELLLRNDISCCSPLAAVGSNEVPCQHSAFRDHVLFCSSPERPLVVVGFKWEKVQLWQLHPPHLPFWDPSTGRLLDVPSDELSREGADGRPSTVGPPTAEGASTQDLLASLLRLLERLVRLMDLLLRSALMALGGTVLPAEFVPELPPLQKPASRRSVSPAVSESTLRCPSPEGISRVPTVESNIERDALERSPVASRANSIISNNSFIIKQQAATTTTTTPTASDWVLENKLAWHRALRRLSDLHSDIGSRLSNARDCLGRSYHSEVSEVDPVLAAFVYRDLLDALREDSPASNPGSMRASLAVKLRITLTELAALQKLRTGPGEERGKVLSFPMVPMPNAVSSIVSIASSSLSSLKRLWPTEEESGNALDVLDIAEEQVTSPLSLLMRSKSKSQFLQPRLKRSNRSGNLDEERPLHPLLFRSRSAERSRDQTPFCEPWWQHSNRAEEAAQTQALPVHLQQVIQTMSRAAEESTCRLAQLDRGVNGICLPVHEDDVGSVIAHALMSHQANEQLAAQWASLPGRRPHCPLAEPDGAFGSGFGACTCFTSMPSPLRNPGAGKKRRQERPSGDGSSAEASGEGTSASSTGARKDDPEEKNSAAGAHGLPSDYTMGVSPAAVAAAAAAAAIATSSPSASSPSDDRPPQPRLAGLSWKRLPGEAGPGSNLGWEEKWERRGVRSVLTAATPSEPVRVDFADSQAQYSVAIYHAPQYHILRHCLCGDDLNFARSLHRCHRITPSGGKTRAAFFVSHDRRFLLKAVNRAEFKMLRTQAEALFWYFDQVLFDKLPSVLAQVIGLFTVSIALRKNSKASRAYFVVQRNLRFSLQSKPHFVFDLKGVGKSRRVQSAPELISTIAEDSDGEEAANLAAAAALVTPGPGSEANGEAPLISTASSSSAGGASAIPAAAAGAASAKEEKASRKAKEAAARPVLWDQNFREWTEGKPLCMVTRDLRYLEAAIFNDTLVLSKQCLMDYSLLLAAVPPDPDDGGDSPGSLCLGIIDYLRPYTWDKQVETAWKSLAQHSSDQPTVIEPHNYARRFLRAMGTYFVAEA